jgi:uncharacterized protein (TIGR04255 family)
MIPLSSLWGFRGYLHRGKKRTKGAAERIIAIADAEPSSVEVAPETSSKQRLRAFKRIILAAIELRVFLDEILRVEFNPTLNAARTEKYHMSLDFERPPINEVVFGVFFPPVPSLKAEAVGLYWTRIRDIFPSVMQQPVYVQQVPAIQMMPQPGELFPMPRFWFLSQDKTRLIQLQNNALLYNWRKQEGDQPGDYPRFNRMFVEFLEHLEVFQKFFANDLQAETPKFTSTELTYINLFGALESLAVPTDYKRVVETFCEHNELEKNLTLENFHHIDFFRAPNGDQFIVTQKSGRHPLESRTVAVLELKVTGALTVPLNDWFSAAHNRINENFLRLTSPEMQATVWRRK